MAFTCPTSIPHSSVSTPHPAQAIDLLKKDIVTLYSKKGPAVVAMNHKAVDSSVENIIKIDTPEAWNNAVANTKLDMEYGSGVETKHLPTAATSGIAMPVGSNRLDKGKVAFDNPQVVRSSTRCAAHAHAHAKQGRVRHGW